MLDSDLRDAFSQLHSTAVRVPTDLLVVVKRRSRRRQIASLISAGTLMAVAIAGVASLPINVQGGNDAVVRDVAAPTSGSTLVEDVLAASPAGAEIVFNPQATGSEQLEDFTGEATGVEVVAVRWPVPFSLAVLVTRAHLSPAPSTQDLRKYGSDAGPRLLAQDAAAASSAEYGQKAQPAATPPANLGAQLAAAQSGAEAGVWVFQGLGELFIVGRSAVGEIVLIHASSEQFSSSPDPQALLDFGQALLADR